MRVSVKKAVWFLLVLAITMLASMPVYAGGLTGTAAQTEEINNQAPTDASAHMHAVITTSNDTYESGTAAIVSVKYTLDQNSIHAGDYVIITIPDEVASQVSFSLNSQHFSGSENLGDGRYKLTFAKDIESGLSGSFNAYVTTKTVTETTPGTISAGDASAEITVIPSGSPGGTGTYTDTIMKDAFENDGVKYSGYDYSEGKGDQAAQIGIADLTEGGTYKYRLYINDKKGEISNVTVRDRIPDGMTFNSGKKVEVTDRESGQEIDPSLYSVNYEGQTLTFRYPGTFSNTLQVNYWVDIPAGSNASKYTNTATITYDQNGAAHQEHRNYVLQGAANNASNGEKSVDKSIISTDPADQFVTYTIKFWNSNGFAAGEIKLTDQLDSHVKFVSADPNDYFSVKQDKADPRKIEIRNDKAIDGSTTTYVRFMVDMSDVPVGYTVKNTVGGNTTRTTKYGGSLSLTASKLLDGRKDGITEGQFKFRLLSESGEVLQTKTNDADGKVAFDCIFYSVDDDGKTFVYQVKEDAGENGAYEYDPDIYTVTVTPSLEKDSDGIPTGKILADPDIQTGDKAAEDIVFNNKTKTTTKEEKISIPVSKIWSGGTGSKAVVHLLADGTEVGTVELNAGNNWHYTFENLDRDKDGKEIRYTLTEDSISGYSTAITYSAESGYTVTNTKTPEIPETPATPGGHNGGGGRDHDSGGGTGAVRLYKADAQTGEHLVGGGVCPISRKWSIYRHLHNRQRRHFECPGPLLRKLLLY